MYIVIKTTNIDGYFSAHAMGCWDMVGFAEDAVNEQIEYEGLPVASDITQIYGGGSTRIVTLGEPGWEIHIYVINYKDKQCASNLYYYAYCTEAAVGIAGWANSAEEAEMRAINFVEDKLPIYSIGTRGESRGGGFYGTIEIIPEIPEIGAGCMLYAKAN